MLLLDFPALGLTYQSTTMEDNFLALSSICTLFLSPNLDCIVTLVESILSVYIMIM